MRYIKYLLGWMKGAKQFKEMKDIPELTEYLKNNKDFKDASWKVHKMKSRFMEKLDEQAFGEEERKKMKRIDEKKK